MILVKNILDSARKRLAVLSREASLIDAAQILANRDTPLVVVCDSDGIAVGVISSSHVIKVLATDVAKLSKSGAIGVRLRVSH